MATPPAKSDLLQSVVNRTPDSELVDMMLNSVPGWLSDRRSNDELARTIRSSLVAALPALKPADPQSATATFAAAQEAKAGAARERELEAIYREQMISRWADDAVTDAARARLLARDPDKEKQMPEITFQIDQERIKFQCTSDELAGAYRAKNAAELPLSLRGFVCHEAINQVSMAVERGIKRDINPHGECITIRRGARGGLFASVPVPSIAGGHHLVRENIAPPLPPEPPVVKEVHVPPSEDELNARLQDAVSKVEDFTSSLSPSSNGPFVAKTILRILKGEITPC
ncbi:hypothetical protein [uncultured Cohaesibacter sp.]|uniref:hypothetical protein n=1 Tax=uncultured Cohaesibacter sp. TaxID=1002546 RepID=UPI0029C6CA12|nr:hypothetical protein [uncultured Cohaesibacter sp.]